MTLNCESKIQRKPIVLSATGAAHGSRIRKRSSQRPRNGRRSACARIAAPMITSTCEASVKTIVFTSAVRKFELFQTSTKFCRPTHVPLSEPDGELVVLVGPSGCGKTSALRMVAGLEEITEGRVWLGERMVNRVPPKDRDIAMIFQNYALYPHMSAYANMAFALKMQKVPKRAI